MKIKSVGSMLTRAVAACVAVTVVAPSIANNLSAGPVVAGTDFAVFGVGGLRGTGIGSIVVSGTSGSISRAILIWHGVSNSTTAVSSTATLGATSFTGNNIGLSSDNCWSLSSSQAFQVDVTSAVTGNGTLTLSIPRGATFDPNGASLLVFFNDGNATNNRDIAVFWGNDSNTVNTFDSAGWNATLSGINYSSGAANLSLIVSDGQNFGETGTNTVTLNALPFTYPLFQGSTVPTAAGSTVTSGGLWDQATATITSALVVGNNTLTLGGSPEIASDCLSLVSAVFNLPAGTITPGPPPPPPPVVTQVSVPIWSAAGFGGAIVATALWGVYAIRRRDESATKNSKE